MIDITHTIAFVLGAVVAVVTLYGLFGLKPWDDQDE